MSPRRISLKQFPVKFADKANSSDFFMKRESRAAFEGFRFSVWLMMKGNSADEAS